MGATVQGLARRDRRIDVLRGVAIALVLIHHFYLASGFGRAAHTGVLAQFVRAVGRNGNYGVTIFFAISGYLITSTSMRRFGSLEALSPRVFYAFRFARIFPCIVLMLVIVTVLGAAGVPYFRNSHGVSFWLADLSVLTFWHNVLMARTGYFNYCLNVLWSLSVEEVFYAVFPLLWLCLRKTRYVLPVWMLAIVIGPIYRDLHRTNEIEFLYGYFACFDAIAAGCCVALLAPRLTVTQKTRNLVQAVAAVIMTWWYLHSSIGSDPVAGPTLMAGLTALFLLVEGAARSDGALRASPTSEPIAWLGSHSYELYLFHIVVLALLRDLFSRSRSATQIAYFALYLVLSTAAAWTVARYYSEPLNRLLRERLAGKRLNRAPAAAAVLLR